MKFNPNRQPEDLFEAIRDGEYPAKVEGVEISSNKNGTGELLKVKFKVTSGKEAGKTVTSFINFKHENERAQKNGQNELLALCNAIGVKEEFDIYQDFSKLARGKELSIAVRVEQYNGRDSNKVDEYFPLRESDSIPF